MVNDFLGEKICCGTYAFLNLVHNKEIDADLFEISMSVPFGVIHKRLPKYDHLLTPYCDPNEGFDGAIKSWGYEVERVSLISAEETVAVLGDRLQEWGGAIIGPIDMGKLFYQPLVNLYRRLDHYIVIRPAGEEYVEIIDSEGIIGEKCSLKQLKQCISTDDILEAKGQYNIRTVRNSRVVKEEDVVAYSFQRAVHNLCMCQQSEEGVRAFQRCNNFLKEIPFNQWGIALLYDLSYLMQRKILHNKLLIYAEKHRILSHSEQIKIAEVINRQILLLGEIFSELRRKEPLQNKAFSQLDDDEKKILELMTNNIKL